MAEIWTSGVWTVTSGQEQAFVDAWRDLATWTSTEFLQGSSAVLLRDAERENVFYSFGPWPDEATVHRWRESEGFRQRISAIRELLESFEPRLAREAAHVGSLSG